MKKLIALLIVATFIVAGCGSDTPSTSLVEKTLVKAMPKADGEDWYAVGFERSNGQLISILGQSAYRVDGKVLLRAANGLVRVNGKEYASVDGMYEKNISVVLVKTERGWDPRLINGLHISYYKGFKDTK